MTSALVEQAGADARTPASVTAISVVIATYNRIDSLLWLLDDLRVQTGVRGGFEVIVVDDGSADGTADIADELAHTYPQVRAVTRRTAIMARR